jgi:uncharacterized protein (TIGR01244 family)
MAAAVGYAAINRSTAVRPLPAVKRLTADVWVSEQIKADNLTDLRSLGIKSLIDLRPDGEAADQPPSTVVANAANAAGLQFAYVPVQHGDIPDASVDALTASLAKAERPVLLYCRSGRRAARTWALSEASRAGGLNEAQIEAAVSSSGQSADDLKAVIATRISARVHN